MPNELMTVRAFCERYAVSRTTFYRLVQRGEIAVCKIGTATRIKVADADAWMASLAA